MKLATDLSRNASYYVSVVVPAFNAGCYIKQTVLSILTSSFRDFVVIVINDGSTDNTESEVRSISDERVILVSQKNSGMSASRNYGIDLVDSEFVALCDADDLWHPRKLELQIDLMSSNKDLGLCYTEFENYYDGDDTHQFNDSSVSSEVDVTLSGYVYHKMLLTNWALPSSVIFRRSLWKRLGPFLCNDHQTDDWEYFVRASLEFKFAKIKSSLVLYRQPPVSLSRKISVINSTELMRQSFIDKYGLVSPQGYECDIDQLKLRQYIGNKSFFDTQLSRGNFRVGFFGLINMFYVDARKWSTFVTLIKSLRRRLFG